MAIVGMSSKVEFDAGHFCIHARLTLLPKHNDNWHAYASMYVLSVEKYSRKIECVSPFCFHVHNF
jgi:hypothetical protein